MADTTNIKALARIGYALGAADASCNSAPRQYFISGIASMEELEFLVAIAAYANDLPTGGVIRDGDRVLFCDNAGGPELMFLRSFT